VFSRNLLRRFVKDFSLPIQLVQEPYFEYYLRLYDRIFETEKLFRLLVETVNKCGRKEQFFQTANRMQEEIIEAVSRTAKYQEFSNDRLERFSVPEGMEKGSIYIPENDGKYFASFDLKKANYNALKFYHPDIVLGTRNYDEFIGRFTELEYFKKAKHLRQVIFGNLNPKKQAKIQKYLIGQLLEPIGVHLPKEKIKATTHDEIVVELEHPDEYFCNADLKEAVERKKAELGIELNTDVFLLRQLKPFPYYVKEHYCRAKVEFKAVPSIFMPQVVKHYFGEEIEEYDLLFYHEGQIAKFVTAISFEKQ